MKTLYRYFFVVTGAILMTGVIGCKKNPADTGWEYAPQMFHSIPLEPYSQKGENPIFADGLNAQKAPEGTIPRDNWYRNEKYMPYRVDSVNLDSAAFVESPLVCNEVNFSSGKRLYETYCIACHGPKGQSQGKITSNKGGPYPPPPNYFNGELLSKYEPGKIFHTMTYGKNLMGSYASQLTPTERWQVVCYVQHLQQLEAKN